jgi:DNA-binding MarR family transcriptional regulator
MNRSAYSLLHRISLIEKKHLPMLQTLVDFDLVVEIGYHQAHGKPLTLKQLFLLGVAPQATAQRRLRRLISLGLATKTFRPDDGRMVELGLTGKMEKALMKYAALVTQAVGKEKNLKRGLPGMIRITTRNMDEPLCGTCAHWDGAREKRDGRLVFIEDSRGVCRRLSEQGEPFLSTFRQSTQAPSSSCWVRGD